MNKAEVFPLFSCPILVGNIGLIPKDMKEYLCNTEFIKIRDNYVQLSKNNFILHDPLVVSLKNEIISSFEKYAYDILKISERIKFKLMNSWIVKCEKGDETNGHVHNNSLLSGVLYLQVDNETDKIIFSTRLPLFSPLIEISFSHSNIFNSDFFSFDVEEGKIIFFPSCVPHRVAPKKSEVVRYSLAFNFFPYGNFQVDNFSSLTINDNEDFLTMSNK